MTLTDLLFLKRMIYEWNKFDRAQAIDIVDKEINLRTMEPRKEPEIGNNQSKRP